jgi:hypothetical protein
VESRGTVARSPVALTIPNSTDGHGQPPALSHECSTRRGQSLRWVTVGKAAACWTIGSEEDGSLRTALASVRVSYLDQPALRCMLRSVAADLLLLH